METVHAIVFALAILSPTGTVKDDFLIGVFDNTPSCQYIQQIAAEQTPEFFEFLEERHIYGVNELLQDGSMLRYTACHELNVAMLPRCAKKEE